LLKWGESTIAVDILEREGKEPVCSKRGVAKENFQKKRRRSKRAVRQRGGEEDRIVYGRDDTCFGVGRQIGKRAKGDRRGDLHASTLAGAVNLSARFQDAKERPIISVE